MFNMPQKTTKTIFEEQIEMGKDESPETKLAVMNNDMKHFNDTLVRIEGKFDSAISGFVTYDKLADAQKAADAKHAEQDDAIKKLEDWNAWAIRIVIGAVILAGLGLVLSGKTPL